MLDVVLPIVAELVTLVVALANDHVVSMDFKDIDDFQQTIEVLLDVYPTLEGSEITIIAKTAADHDLHALDVSKMLLVKAL